LKLEEKINRVKTPPARIIQPLPSSWEEAFQWIFFLYRPPELKFISTYTIVAKQLFVPKELIVETLSFQSAHYSILEGSQIKLE
jgi:hypothetical protein